MDEEIGWINFNNSKGLEFFKENLNQLLAVPGSTKEVFTLEELVHNVDLCEKSIII